MTEIVMTNPNTEVVLRQFKFLRKLFPEESIKNARVERIDEKLADQSSGLHTTYGGPAGTLRVPNNVLLLDQAGALIARLGVIDIEQPASKFLWWTIKWPQQQEYFEETVWNALQRCQENLRFVCYVVSFNDGRLILYKPPKGWTVELWLRRQLNSAAENLQKHLAEIDAEG